MGFFSFFSFLWRFTYPEVTFGQRRVKTHGTTAKKPARTGKHCASHGRSSGRANKSVAGMQQPPGTNKGLPAMRAPALLPGPCEWAGGRHNSSSAQLLQKTAHLSFVFNSNSARFLTNNPRNCSLAARGKPSLNKHKQRRRKHFPKQCLNLFCNRKGHILSVYLSATAPRRRRKRGKKEKAVRAELCSETIAGASRAHTRTEHLLRRRQWDKTRGQDNGTRQRDKTMRRVPFGQLFVPFPLGKHPWSAQMAGPGFTKRAAHVPASTPEVLT